MKTHTGSQFANHLGNISQVTVKGCWQCCRIERLVSVAPVDPSYQKSINKTFRKYSASGHEMGLQILSNRTTRHSWCRTVIPPVWRFVNDRGRIVAVSHFKKWKVHVVIFSFHPTHFHILLTPLDFYTIHFQKLFTNLHFRYVNARFDFRYVDSSTTVDES